MAIPLCDRETRRTVCGWGRSCAGADVAVGIDELILDEFKTVRPGGDSGLIRVWAELRRRSFQIVGARWLLDSVLVSDVQVDVMREECTFHRAFNARLRCVISRGSGINHDVIELYENILLVGPRGIVGIGERHKLAGSHVRVSLVLLPYLQKAILVVVMNCCGDDHCAPGHASHLAAARHDHCCCRIVIFVQRICKIRKHRVWKDPGRIIPVAVPARECRLAVSIRRGKRYGGSLDAVQSAA